MSTKKPPTYEEVLAAIRTWPLWQRFEPVQHVLQTIASELPPDPDREKTRREALQRLGGILATDKPPPSDEEVERWLDEHRMEKYGR